MSKQTDQERIPTERPPPPAAGLLFLVGGFGFFYSFITIVDPLL